MSDEKRRGADDRLALGAVILGAVIAFIGRRDPMLLGTGAAVGVAGVILGLRGDRSIRGRGWLRAALWLAVIGVAGGITLDRYQEWIVGQWFAEGATSVATTREIRRMTETAATLRLVAAVSSVAMLLGAILNRLK